MNSLKKKIFILLTSLMTIFLIVLLVIFNISIYNNEKQKLYNKYKRLDSNRDSFFVDGFNPFFIEDEIYEIVTDKTNNVSEIISYSDSKLTKKKAYNIFNSNFYSFNSKKLESLYTSKYIVNINSRNNIVIINNEFSKNYLCSMLIESLVVFILLEAVIWIGSYEVTKWIVKPVAESFQKQKQFIYDASHELKTPIAIIAASAETLEKDPKEKKWLENIKSENDRMAGLVKDLLELSKSENIKETAIYQKVDLSKLVENKALAFESLLFENNLKLETNITKNIEFNCDADRIKELLSILVDNAIKHADKKSKINVNLLKQKNNIILEVVNRGAEIPQNEREKIFERFYRIDKSRNRDENRYGLGLSIAKNIVINHNGEIKVSCGNGYTTFTVNFKQK